MITSKHILEKVTRVDKDVNRSSSSLLEVNFTSVKEAYEKLSPNDFIAYFNQLILPVLQREPLFKHLSQFNVYTAFKDDPLNRAITIDYRTDLKNDNNEIFTIIILCAYQIRRNFVYISSYIVDKKAGQTNTLVKGQSISCDSSISSIQTMITKQTKKMVEKYNKLMAMTVRKYYW